MAKDYYLITIPCKPYVRRFLVNTYGHPVNLKSDKHAFRYFRLLLQRKMFRNNHRTGFKRNGKMIYRTEVEIILDNDTFKHYGYGMSRQAVIDFNAFFEGYIKKVGRTFIAALESSGWKRWHAIREYQDTFGFREDEYSGEAILQDLKRHPEKISKKLVHSR